MKMFKGRNNSLRHQLRRTWTRLRGDYPKRLPDFLVIGATRSGTTTLNRILGAHPEIFVPPGKELHYFNNERLFRDDLSGYRELFGGYSGQRIIGEVTPSYWKSGAVFGPNGERLNAAGVDALKRIAIALPDAKLVVSLRDPLDRLRSGYIKNFYQGRIDHSLERDVALEATSKSVLEPIRGAQYHLNIQRILELFPQENLKIMIFEEWTRDQATAIPDLFSFLGADPNVPLAPVASNNAERYRKASDRRTPEPDLSPEARRRVIDATAESRAWLEDFLGRELPWERE